MIVEIPQHSANKYEYDGALGVFRLDRALYSPLHYPGDYGFIPGTLADDNDPLDVLVLVQQPSYPGVMIEVRPVGVLNMVDSDEKDQKILAVPNRNPRYDQIHTMDQIFRAREARDRTFLFHLQRTGRQGHDDGRLGRPARSPQGHSGVPPALSRRCTRRPRSNYRRRPVRRNSLLRYGQLSRPAVAVSAAYASAWRRPPSRRRFWLRWLLAACPWNPRRPASVPRPLLPSCLPRSISRARAPVSSFASSMLSDVPSIASLSATSYRSRSGRIPLLDLLQLSREIASRTQSPRPCLR